MGGNAFKALLPHASFPRMTPVVYEALKARLTPQLHELYGHVTVPKEAPGKQDHGDVDFVVCQPRDGLSHDEVRTTLGAVQSIACDGISNFAIRSIDFDGTAAANDFYQIDVQVCNDYDDWERAVFFGSYGDVGMILGLMARPYGLSMGRNGLKFAKPLPTSPPIIFHLSQSFPSILDFFNLSMDRWTQGFTSEQDIFAWIASSRFFDPRRMVRSEESNTYKTKARNDRKMYQHFLDFARTCAEPPQRYVSDHVLNEAVDTFGKRPLHTVIVRIAEIKRYVTANFSGALVQGWTGLQGMPIRITMNEVRSRLGGEGLLTVVSGIPLDSLPSDDIDPVHLTLRAWESTMAGLSADEIKDMVVAAKGELAAEGKLTVDWKAEKQRKAELKKLQKNTV